MKLKLTKRILCFILTFCFITGAVTPAFAETQEARGKDVTPVILVPGIGSSALYLNPNTDEQTSPVSIGGSFIGDVIKSNIIGSTLSACAGMNVNAEKYIEKLSFIITPFTALACDEDGNSADNIGIDCYWEEPLSNHLEYLDSRNTAEPAVAKGLCDAIGAENVYIFNYDFRLDVVDYAIQLSDFIDNVKAQKNCEKVTLVSASLGTCIVSTYIDMYKDKNDIKRTVFLDGAFQGVSMTRLFQKDFYLDTEVVFNFLNGLAQCYKGSAVDFETITKWINRFDGTAENLIDFLKELSNEENIVNLYTEVLLPIIGNMPSLWECIPYDYFDDCVKAMTDIGWLQTDSGLYEKITRYHAIQGRLEQNLTELKNNGVEVAIVCGYGFPGMPCTSEYNNTTDMLIDTRYASAGAVTADYGDTIAQDVAEKYSDKQHLSADGMIYSGSCILPDQTWFCKYVQHMEFVYDTDVNRFVSTIATTDSPINVEAIKELTGYGQFTAVDNDYNLINVEQASE